MSGKDRTDTDDLGSIPSVIPEREDIVDRQGRRSSGMRNGKPASDKPVVGMTALNSASNVLAPVLLALVLMGALIGIGYLYKQLQKTQENLAVTVARVEQLESRLASTDTTLTKSEVLLAAKLKSMDVMIDGNKSEARKLWAASEKNTHSLQTQGIDLQQQKILLQGASDQIQQMSTRVISDSALLKSVESTAKESAQRIEITQETLSDLSADTKTLKEKQSRLENDIGKRVVVLEDTAKSTDVFRRNTLDELRKLREELSRQQAQSAAATKPAP